MSPDGASSRVAAPRNDLNSCMRLGHSGSDVSRLTVLHDHSFMVIAGNAIERALTVIRTFAINPGKHHRRAALWAGRSLVAQVRKV